MTGGPIRQVAACPAALLEHHPAGRMAAHTHRTLAELLSNESLSIQKPTPLASVDASSTSVTYDAENSLRDESGLAQRRADSAHVRTTTSDSPVQSASLELAWRVVFAAEQRKAALMEHARPLGFKRRRSDEKISLSHREATDRPAARNYPPRVGLGGANHFSLQVVSAAAAQETECVEREELERSRDSRANPSSREAVAVARRRAQGQAIAAEPNCGIAVSGQSLIVRRPTTPCETDEWAQEATLQTNARYLIENGMGHPIPAFVEQADLSWQSLSSADGQAQASPPVRSDILGQANSACAGWTEDIPPALLIQRALPAGLSGGRPSWPHALAEKPDGTLGKRSESSPERPRTSGEPEHIATADRPRTVGDSDRVAGQDLARTRASASNAPIGRDLRHVPSYSDDNDVGELQVEGSQLDSVVVVEKTSSTVGVAASARAARRTTFSLAPRVTVNNSSRADVAASSATASEPLSPQRPGASIRRSRSMPAPRKSAEESASKPKLARSSGRHRSLASGHSSSMPKSTAAAAAGAGSVAAKKRAKSSKKLMLPFAYAEDDPRVGHVESCEAPEARLPLTLSQFSSGQ